MAAGKPVKTEKVLLFENNRLVEVATIPYKDTDNKWKVIELKVDITERKRNEAGLLQEASLISSLLDSIPDIVF